MKPVLRSLAILASVWSLQGCGGGEPGGAFVFNAFVGLWVNGCERNTVTGGSERVHIRLTELSSTSLSGSFAVTTYTSTDCSGPPSSTVQFAIVQNGTQSMSGDTVIQITIAGDSGSSRNDLLSVRNHTLYLGNAIIGPNGYPTAIDFSRPLGRI